MTAGLPTWAIDANGTVARTPRIVEGVGTRGQGSTWGEPDAQSPTVGPGY